MTSYRGVEAIDCVGMQLVVEPDLGLCDNLKPNRFLGIERKRLIRTLRQQGPLFYLKGILHMDLLTQSAIAWKEITEYRYLFTYGYKKKLYPINLTFSPEDYPHLAGFQYMKDISLPNYTSAKMVDRILDGKITFSKIQEAAQYEELIKPRLEALINLKNSLDNEFTLYSYMPRMYPFITGIKADYLIASHFEINSFVFIIQATPLGDAKCDFLCCSIFSKGDRDYETNQRSRALLKKERIHISSDTTAVLMDKLTPQDNKTESEKD